MGKGAAAGQRPSKNKNHAKLQDVAPVEKTIIGVQKSWMEKCLDTPLLNISLLMRPLDFVTPTLQFSPLKGLILVNKNTNPHRIN